MNRVTSRKPKLYPLRVPIDDMRWIKWISSWPTVVDLRHAEVWHSHRREMAPPFLLWILKAIYYVQVGMWFKVCAVRISCCYNFMMWSKRTHLRINAHGAPQSCFSTTPVLLLVLLRWANERLPCMKASTSRNSESLIVGGPIAISMPYSSLPCVASSFGLASEGGLVGRAHRATTCRSTGYVDYAAPVALKKPRLPSTWGMLAKRYLFWFDENPKRPREVTTWNKRTFVMSTDQGLHRGGWVVSQGGDSEDTATAARVLVSHHNQESKGLHQQYDCCHQSV